MIIADSFAIGAAAVKGGHEGGLEGEGENFKALRECDGYLSGQQLCELLGVSRTAVWKAIHRLSDEGYAIEAVNKKVTGL